MTDSPTAVLGGVDADDRAPPRHAAALGPDPGARRRSARGVRAAGRARGESGRCLRAHAAAGRRGRSLSVLHI